MTNRRRPSKLLLAMTALLLGAGAAPAEEAASPASRLVVFEAFTRFT